MAERKPPKSPYTIDRADARRLRGRDGHPPAVRERRRPGRAASVAAGAFLLPALGFALGPVFEEKEQPWQAVGAPRRVRARHLRRRARSRSPRRSATPGSRRSTCASSTRTSTPRSATSTTSTSRSRPRCMHLGCPVQYVTAVRSASSARATAASTTSSARSSAARRSARSTASTRASPPAPSFIGPRFSVNSELRALQPARPGRAARRRRPVPLPVPSHDAQAPEHLSPMPKIPAPPVPGALQPTPKRPGKDYGPQTPVEHGHEGAASAVGWIDERTSLSGGARWMMFRKVPKGTNWFYTLGLGHDVRLPLAGGDRRLPGDVLRALGDPRPTTRSGTSTTRSSSASSCTACTSGARR